MTDTLVKDAVCGMNVEATEAGARSEYLGQKYYFCCSGCKAKFDHEPEKFLSLSGADRQGDKSSCCCS